MPIPLAGLFTAPIFAKILSWIITYTIVRILVSMGFALIIFGGMELTWNIFRDAVETLLTGLPVTLVQLLEMSGAMFAVNLMLSTVGAVVTIKGVLGFRKAVFR